MENNLIQELQENTGITNEQAIKVVSYLRGKYNEQGKEWFMVLFSIDKIVGLHSDNNSAVSDITNENDKEAENLNIHTESEDIEEGGYMKGNRALNLMEDELYRAASTNGIGTSIGSLNKR